MLSLDNETCYKENKMVDCFSCRVRNWPLKWWYQNIINMLILDNETCYKKKKMGNCFRLQGKGMAFEMVIPERWGTSYASDGVRVCED